MKQSKSSKRWLQEHFDDVYVKKAQIEGYRSRAVYKLKEIDEKENLIQPGMTIVDLGAAPGGWTQYIAKKLKGKAQIIALDILPMEPVVGAEFLQGDFTDDEIFEKFLALIPDKGVDVVLSDMAPNMSGSKVIDIPKAMYLAELSFDFAEQVLKPGGMYVVKLFHGTGFDQFIQLIRSRFTRVVIRKPNASRPRSKETYLFAKGFKPQLKVN